MLDRFLAAFGLAPSGLYARVAFGAVEGWVVCQPAHQLTPTAALPNPIERLAVDDPVGPDAEACRVLKPPQPADDGDPGFLDDLGGRLRLLGSAIRMADEPRVPPVGQGLQCVGAATLGLDDEPFLQDFLRTA